ncbi:MAG TPA: sensor histidine kinase [Chitinophagaceae bacterium]|jgi:two-component system sensor histidine kinase UhpB|nr:sensor histidine kinase [Chitinophagaceae bacterium]
MTGISLFKTTHSLPYLAGNTGNDSLTIVHQAIGSVAWEENIRNEERKFIGQELHDNVNQILSSAKLFADMLRPSTDHEKMIKEKIIAYVLMAIEEIRCLSSGLVNCHEQSRLLKDHIQQIIDDLRFSTGMGIEFNYCNDLESLDGERKTALLRIVQEQLKNIMVHSRATTIRIDMRYENDMAVLLVKDNGIGFDTSKAGTGIGLPGISERAACFKGTICLQSSPGKGCSLQVNIPAVS